MKPNNRSNILFLQDIVLAMSRIQEYLEGFDFIRFKRDYKTVDAVMRNFEIIGEASKHLSRKFKAKHSHLPWEEMYRLRNRISHEYFGIDYDVVWNIATQQLPHNQKDVEKILEREKRKN